ncbi:carbon monoxide dehydrogenase subunit G [Polaromonas sp.]|jgi:carbon monoxide dehydrogenase subunit G|uniref:CoxG family protein n=1 Tax=Polaromonas sp. TaxID=1869339 RepID=UPI002BBCC01E|nr:carbon monoxide dehydrogenase subunit G [Polaromonas sp.]HQS31064.1 carbon monoxide dehydrogenase subunit G [Polaromonas sp.]HQS90203.1 carbon monoxide dehydrogenase subunit G [Polaromonas sp.]
MDMQGSRQLAISQQQAWDALNDPAVLKACIPGCDKVEPTGENQYTIGMALKIGPVSAKFSGKITLSEINPPASYKLSFEGQGGPAGFGKGSAEVKLTPNEGGCELSYTVHASVGGKIAQLGQRLIDGAAKSMAEDFFRRFDEEMQRQHPESYAAKAEATAPSGAAPATGAKGGIPAWVWGAGVVLAAVVAYLVTR